MPKKSAKKTKATEGAEVENIKTVPEQKKPDIKEYINQHYAHSAGDYKWVWIVAVTFTVIILSLWAWLSVLQISRLSQQMKQDSVNEKIDKNLDKNFEQIRVEQSVTQQLKTAWDNLVASIATSTVSSTPIASSTTSTIDMTTTTPTATATTTTTNTIQTTNNR